MQGVGDAGGRLLEIDQVSVRFGGIQALDGVSCFVDRGEICGLIGPNGAGKTTLFNCITRLYSASSGRVLLKGERIDRLAPRQIISRGIARTFQNLGIYARMTVLENVLVGAHHRYASPLLHTLVQPWRADAEEHGMVETCRSILAELGLDRHADQQAGDLPFGSLKRLEIARALASRPKLLLLDEPASGLTHQEALEFGAVIMRLRSAFDLTILLVEHNMGLVMDLCDRLIVLHLGRKLAEGHGAAMRADPAVIAAYLGDAQ
jgi:branched-chain amino acid transport system ATP-binding protein